MTQILDPVVHVHACIADEFQNSSYTVMGHLNFFNETLSIEDEVRSSHHMHEYQKWGWILYSHRVSLILNVSAAVLCTF